MLVGTKMEYSKAKHRAEGPPAPTHVVPCVVCMKTPIPRGFMQKPV